MIFWKMAFVSKHATISQPLYLPNWQALPLNQIEFGFLFSNIRYLVFKDPGIFAVQGRVADRTVIYLLILLAASTECAAGMSKFSGPEFLTKKQRKPDYHVCESGKFLLGSLVLQKQTTKKDKEYNM